MPPIWGVFSWDPDPAPQVWSSLQVGVTPNPLRDQGRARSTPRSWVWGGGSCCDPWNELSTAAASPPHAQRHCCHLGWFGGFHSSPYFEAGIKLSAPTLMCKFCSLNLKKKKETRIKPWHWQTPSVGPSVLAGGWLWCPQNLQCRGCGGGLGDSGLPGRAQRAKSSKISSNI